MLTETTKVTKEENRVFLLYFMYKGNTVCKIVNLLYLANCEKIYLYILNPSY